LKVQPSAQGSSWGENQYVPALEKGKGSAPVQKIWGVRVHGNKYRCQRGLTGSKELALRGEGGKGVG